MYALDAAVAAALAGRHAPRARFSFLASDRSVLTGYDSRRSILTSGTCTFDRTRVGRRSGTVTLANPRGLLSPATSTDPAFPSNLVRLERGPVIDGRPAYVLLATLRIASFQATMAGVLTLTLEDVLQAVAQPFGDVVRIAAGTPAGEALRTCWEPVMGDSSAWSIDDGGRTTAARDFLEDEDRLGAVAQLLADLGLEVFSDRTGNVVLRPIPDPLAAAIARRFERARGSATMMDLARSGSQVPYNKVIVVAERLDGTVLRAVAEVTDTSSPIHSSRIGVRTAPLYRSAQIPDQAAANAIATALLVQYSLYQDAVGGTAFPALELDEDDVVEFVEPISGTDDRYRIERITHPLLDGGTVFEQATKVLPVFVTV